MSEKSLTVVEAELYDRQIRLWGIESQEKLRAANILLIGVRGLGSEIAKDILLSGINSLTILDDADVTEPILRSNFLLSKDSLGKKLAESVLAKAQALNPLVSITIDTNKVSSKDEEFFTKFTIIVGTCLETTEITKLADICRESSIKLICGDVFGLFGYTMSDFQEHQYFEEIPKMMPTKKRAHDDNKVKYEQVMVKVQETMTYPPLTAVLLNDTTKATKAQLRRRNPLYYLMLSLLRFRDETHRDPANAADTERLRAIIQTISAKANVDVAVDVMLGVVAPVCSIVGGVIAQEVIKAVSGKEVPIRNVFLLDPATFNGKEEFIQG